MSGRTLGCVLVVLAACKAQISGAPGDPVLVDSGAEPIDAGPVADAALGAWGKPAKVAVASSTTVGEDDLALSADTRELFFAIDTGTNGKDLYYASRASATAAWTTPVALAFNSATQSDETPRLSADEKTLYFASSRAGNGTLDIYMTTRSAPGATIWSTPVQLTVSTATLIEKWYAPCGARYILAQTHAATGSDLMEGTAGGAAPTLLAELNSPQNEIGASLTPDCLTIYFASNRAGTVALYTSKRASLAAPFAPPTLMTEFAAVGGNQEDPWLSPDGRTFGFVSDVAGTKDLYLSTR